MSILQVVGIGVRIQTNLSWVSQKLLGYSIQYICQEPCTTVMHSKHNQPNHRDEVSI